MRTSFLIAAIVSFAGLAVFGGEPPGSESQAPASPKLPPEGEEEAKVDQALLEEYRAAARILETSTDFDNLLEALEILREGFPESRVVLHECARSRVAQARSFALRALGEKGDPEKDLPVAEAALRDPDKNVRFAAVMAIRSFGTAGLAKLLEYLPGETEPNNRKMAIKTLQHWGDKKAVPPLVRLLRNEKDRGVRNFIVTALEVLTRCRFGDDIEAWEAHAERLALQEQAERLLGEPPLQGAKKPPEVKR